MAVTQILGELKMDAESVVAGLLHDTVEDTDVTFQYIEEVRGCFKICVCYNCISALI